MPLSKGHGLVAEIATALPIAQSKLLHCVRVVYGHQVLYFYFVSKALCHCCRHRFFRASGGGLVVFPPPEGHITRRSIFTFLGLRARTLHLGAERYSDSCCLYGVCGLKSFCFFCSKSVACSCAACDLKKQATNQPTSSAFCCCVHSTQI